MGGAKHNGEGSSITACAVHIAILCGCLCWNCSCNMSWISFLLLDACDSAAPAFMHVEIHVREHIWGKAPARAVGMSAGASENVVDEKYVHIMKEGLSQKNLHTLSVLSHKY